MKRRDFFKATGLTGLFILFRSVAEAAPLGGNSIICAASRVPVSGAFNGVTLIESSARPLPSRWALRVMERV